MIKHAGWELVVRQGKVYIPQIARTEGPYLATEPVDVLDTSDRNAIEQSLLRAVERGNPVIPLPPRDAYPKYVLLKYANVKSLSAFERTAEHWQLEKTRDAYVIIPMLRAERSSFVPDMEHSERFPLDTPITAVIHRLLDLALAV